MADGQAASGSFLAALPRAWRYRELSYALSRRDVLSKYRSSWLGLAWILNALGVYVRDTTYVAGFIGTAMLFLSPVFYPASAVPERFYFLLDFNPLTFYIEVFRDIAVLGNPPDAGALTTALLVALATFVVGYWFFERVKKGFADVL